ncbi:MULTISPECIES: fimbrial protein [Serratia]|uniref:MrfF protein n=2 Tax=Serratia TaxID=613 RepID=A8GL21_SERP5|nr:MULTISPECIES: fimbrial protein [Serratia]MCS4268398.1 type 1 fimbria pilin [Serratia sp. BIGb0163]RYM60435.1 pilus assembly protein [Serratia proteamaculans]CAI1109508.1 putative minor fimbrial subunit StfF [Serratia quinivorans]CAI1174501.1 putative minor fimbrial subunit StfF [Serratia quinivorans]CAI1787267.1 putative minor fimbrial subunit StfF [Serratia proteamaculans]
MNKKYAIFALLAAVSTLSVTLPIQAIEILFNGRLVQAPACEINDGRAIDVNFGERVGVSKVDGVNYLQTIDYRVTCQPGATTLELGLSVVGPPTAFDGAALQTNVADLGIRLLQNGQPLQVNHRIVIDPKNPPHLQAVPVKKAGVGLPEGVFEVTATLLADYQ